MFFHPLRTARRVLLLAAGIAIFLTTLPEVSAQPRKVRRYYKRHTTVALQPFSLERQRRVRFAYNTSRAVQKARPADEDDDASDSNRPVVSGGSRPTVPGKRAVLRNGIAYAPASAPESVKTAIWATNQIRHKPYVWGGGHGSFNDSGYDCSGTVSYALHHAGVLGSPVASSDLMRFGERGRGRWITVYSRRGHTFATIAGLRLDTTDFRIGGDVGPRWHLDSRDTRGYSARHPSGL